MKKREKLISAFLATAMICNVAVFTGCNNKDENGNPINNTKNRIVISEDDPWYTVNKININGNYSNDEVDYQYYYYLGSADDGFIILNRGQKSVPADIDWETYNNNDYRIEDINTYDSNGNLINSVNMVNLSLSESENIRDYEVEGNNLNLFIESYNDAITHYYTATMDLSTGEISELVPQSNGDFDFDSLTYGTSWSGDVTVGRYTISKFYTQIGFVETYKLVVSDGAGNTSEMSFGDDFSSLKFYSIDCFIPIDDTNCYIVASAQEGLVVFTMNLDTLNVSRLSDEEISWLDGANGQDVMNFGDEFLLVDDNGVRRVDFGSSSLEDVFSFEECNFNREYASQMDLVDYDDNTFTYFSNHSTHYGMIQNTSEVCLYVFTKADTNPNAGKTILDVACLGEVTEAIANAVCEYNDTNDSYYLVFNNDYNAEQINYDGARTPDDYNQLYLDAQLDMSNRLTIDLLSGEGPDIIIGGFDYGQLNNENYLVDLSPYMSEFGVAGYFSNIFESAKIDGKLYQVPVSFILSGIITDSDYVSDGQLGFTFEQYRTFVDDICNGVDPMGAGQLSYMVKCMDAMSGMFVDNGTANYDNAAFRELCAYVKDNVFEVVHRNMYDISEDMPHAAYESMHGFVSYIDDAYNNCYMLSRSSDSLSFLGVPSYDGRGVSAVVTQSVGVSTQVPDVDACWQFVEILLGDNAQETIAKSFAFPVNVNAYETASLEIVDNYNALVRGDQNYSLSGWASSSVEVDPSVVTELEVNCINNAQVSMPNSSISIIVIEEIPAYLTDQKTLDEVIDIIENRVNVLLSEA